MGFADSVLSFWFACEGLFGGQGLFGDWRQLTINRVSTRLTEEGKTPSADKYKMGSRTVGLGDRDIEQSNFASLRAN